MQVVIGLSRHFLIPLEKNKVSHLFLSVPILRTHFMSNHNLFTVFNLQKIQANIYNVDV